MKAAAHSGHEPSGLCDPGVRSQTPGHVNMSAADPGARKLEGTREVTGRLCEWPNPVLFQLLYQQDAAHSLPTILPYLLKIDAAHVVMLAHTKLISTNVAASLLRVNVELKDLLLQGKEVIPVPHQHRGSYFLYEQEYVRRLGKTVGGAAHLARSRNDINATVTRMRLRDELLAVLSEFCKLSGAMTTAVLKYSDTVMTGFTHLQPAQPSTLGHYLAGILEELMRSAEALDRCFEIVNCSPMGAAAGFGTSLPIDRGEVAHFLGFEGVIANSADAVASRDYLVHALSSMALMGVTLTRVANDFQAWASTAYGFLGWKDDLVSTSSIMPQKRNAFVLENIRGKGISPLGGLVNTIAAMKNVSFTNSVEVSAEATAHIWPAIASLLQAMQLLKLLLEHLEVYPERMLAFMADKNVTMTAVADWLAANYGLAFRTAHDCVSHLVNQYPVLPGLEETRLTLETVVSETTGVVLELDQNELADLLDPVMCARKAIFGGGPGVPAVQSQVRSTIARAGRIETQLQARCKNLQDADCNLFGAVHQIVHSIDTEVGNHDCQ